jgi:hypothetical protein
MTSRSRLSLLLPAKRPSGQTRSPSPRRTWRCNRFRREYAASIHLILPLLWVNHFAKVNHLRSLSIFLEDLSLGSLTSYFSRVCKRKSLTISFDWHGCSRLLLSIGECPLSKSLARLTAGPPCADHQAPPRPVVQT